LLLADLKNFFPDLFILRKHFNVVLAEHVRIRRPDFFHGLDVGMGRSLADAFGPQRDHRRPFLYARRKLVRIASKANRPLAGNEKLDELRMAAVKLHLVHGDALDRIDGLVIAPKCREITSMELAESEA